MKQSVKVGVGSENEREIAVKDCYAAKYHDQRIVLTRELVDGTYILEVQNPKNSGRNEQCVMWLSEDSLIGIIGSAILYLESKGIGLDKIASRFSGNIAEYYSPDSKK